MAGQFFDPSNENGSSTGANTPNNRGTPGDGWSGGASMAPGGSGVNYDPYAAKDPGKVRDPRAWGGYGATLEYDENGNLVANMGANGRQADVDRYRGMAEAAANRGAYQNNYAAANVLSDAGARARGYQGDAMGLYRDAAMGINSQSQRLGNQMMMQGAQAQQAAALSTRGGSLAQAAALRAQQGGEAAYMQQGRNQLDALLAQEMAAGRSGYMDAATQQRSGDYTSQGMNQQQAIAQMQNELQQRQRNQAAQMGYEGMAQAVNKAALEGGIQNSQIDAGIYTNQKAYDERQKDSDLRMFGAGAGAAGATLGAVSNLGGDTGGSWDYGQRAEKPGDPYSDAISKSDERAKMNAHRIGMARASDYRGKGC